MSANVLTPWQKTEILHHQEPDQPAERNDAGPPSVRAPGVLVVDDDRVVRTLLNIVLQDHGFAVWLTADGYQALKAYQGHRDDIDLVLIDVRMPGLDGPQTLAALYQFNQQLRCCFMTGDLGRYTEEELMERGAERIFYKPLRLAEVARILRELVSSAPAPRPTAGYQVNTPDSLTGGALTEWQLFDGRLRRFGP